MNETKPGRGADQFPLRFPDGMRERLKGEAARNGRSMNAEIISRLESTFDLDDHIRSKEGMPPPSFEDYGMSGADNLRRPPGNKNLDEYMRSIFEQLRELNMKVSSVRIQENGETEYTISQDRFPNHPDDSEPFPPPTDEELFHIIEARASDYGYKLVKKDD